MGGANKTQGRSLGPGHIGSYRVMGLTRKNTRAGFTGTLGEVECQYQRCICRCGCQMTALIGLWFWAAVAQCRSRGQGGRKLTSVVVREVLTIYLRNRGRHLSEERQESFEMCWFLSMGGFRERSQCLMPSDTGAVIRHLRVGVASAPAGLMRYVWGHRDLSRSSYSNAVMTQISINWCLTGGTQEPNVL